MIDKNDELMKNLSNDLGAADTAALRGGASGNLQILIFNYNMKEIELIVE